MYGPFLGLSACLDPERLHSCTNSNMQTIIEIVKNNLAHYLSSRMTTVQERLDQKELTALNREDTLHRLGYLVS
jgi:hypothetical protein